MKTYCPLISFLFLVSSSSFAQGKTETLKTMWPEEYNWKAISTKEDSILNSTEWILESDSTTDTSVKGTSITYKSTNKVPLSMAMNMMLDQVKMEAPKAVATPIERNDKAKFPWMLFKIEIPRFKNDKNPESRLYYIVQGEQNLYSNFIITKEKTLKAEFVQKWAKIFKESSIE